MRNKGFTLVELLIIIAILAVTAAIGIPAISSIVEKSGMNADRVTAQQIETCIDTWMNTEYSNENFFRTNLYTSASSGIGAAGRINGYTEQMYSYYFAGTGQLPGVELTSEEQIRHSVITSIKATSNMKLDKRDEEQFVEAPQAGSQFGFKYYYKIGRVSVERVDSVTSALGNDEVYRYFIWLDRSGGTISSEITEKHYKGYEYLYVGNEPLYSLRFDFGTKAVGKVRVVIEKDGLTYTLLGERETPEMFKFGTYSMYFYYDGELYREIQDYILSADADVISAG